MPKMYHCVTTIALSFFVVSLSDLHLSAAELTATVGKQTVVMQDGQFGFHGFPDESINVINKSPLRFLMVVGNSTVLMEGSSFEKARPVTMVLGPSNSPGAYDEQYAGISGVYVNKKEVLGFFHAEKPTGGKNESGTPRFYASIGLAVSKDGGHSFEKVGQVLTGRPEDPNWKGTAQGDADVSICVDHTGEWLHAYYTEHSRQNPANGQARSVITCMARSKLADGGKPGAWKKYYNGSFDEPGLGGKDSEVADCWAPNVTYIKEVQKYLMVGSRGNIVCFMSDDGIKWSAPTVLVKTDDLPIVPGKGYCWHPSLCIERASPKNVKGWLFYGHNPQHGPAFLVKRPITFK